MSRAAPLLDHFSDLTDPRVARTREHSLESILFIAICAVIAGEDDWVGIPLCQTSCRLKILN